VPREPLAIGDVGTVSQFRSPSRRGVVVSLARVPGSDSPKKIVVIDDQGKELSMFVDQIHRIRTRGPMTTHYSFEPDKWKTE
jgi:hypothetical protein